MRSPQSSVVIVMGVAGVGKTTVGKALAASLKWRFIEGDDFHPPANIAKMRNGEALDDRDRAPWLTALRDAIAAQLVSGKGAVISCSALKTSYRRRLRVDEARVKFVYLEGDYELIHGRLHERKTHFMPAALLASQLQTLEMPDDALVVDARKPVAHIVLTIRAALEL